MSTLRRMIGEVASFPVKKGLVKGRGGVGGVGFDIDRLVGLGLN